MTKRLYPLVPVDTTKPPKLIDVEFEEVTPPSTIAKRRQDELAVARRDYEIARIRAEISRLNTQVQWDHLSEQNARTYTDTGGWNLNNTPEFFEGD